MGPDACTTPPTSPAEAGAGALPRCPSCAAVVRPAAPWCTQCYLDLREPAKEPAPQPEPALAPAEPPDGDPTWPCSACGSANPLAADVCATCDSPFLAGLRATDPPLLVLPGLGDVGALSRTRRLCLAVGAVLAVATVVLALGLL